MINYSQIESVEQIANCKKQLKRRINSQEKVLNREFDHLKNNFSVVSTLGRSVLNVASLTHTAATMSRKGLLGFFTFGYKLARTFVERKKKLHK